MKLDESKESDVHSWWERQTWIQLVAGGGIVFGVAVTWVGATQFSKSSLARASRFYAPYFAVWFSTNFMLLCYPIYLIYALLIFNNVTKKPKSMQQIHRQALGHISAGETTAVMSSNPAFVCLFGWLILRDKFVMFRTIALVLATLGIILIAYDQGLSQFTFIGVMMALASSIIAALYKIFFKRVFTAPTLGQVSLFMTFLGVQNIIFNSVPTAMLAFTQLETIKVATIPWMYIIISSVFGCLFNFLVNFGIALTHPLFISIGLFIGMPMNGFVDLLWRQTTQSIYMIFGSIFILTSFIILLIPTNWHKRSKNSVVNVTANTVKV